MVSLTGRMGQSDDKEYKEKLIRNVKREVKQIMEEAVTRKFVHEESSCITALCGAVEACLSDGLRRRALGLFKSSSTTALLHKVGKNYEPAGRISRLVMEAESGDRRSSSSGDSSSRLIKPSSPNPQTQQHPPPLQKKNSGSVIGQQEVKVPKYLWIRLALFDKQLAKIIDHLVQNASKYYEKEALVCDPDYGSILSSLLVGPCALDYSKMKTQDHLWSDPPADELVQRHRMSSAHFGVVPSGGGSSANAGGGVSPNTPPQPRRPGLQFRKGIPGPSSSEDSLRSSSLSLSAKDYVESLHQNNRATLLYGKNNVLVHPKDLPQPLPGYLSLHQMAENLTIKWTPNQLMNGCCDPNDTQDKRCSEGFPRRGSIPLVSTFSAGRTPPSFVRRYSDDVQIPSHYVYWQYAMNVRVDDVVYVHCHQQAGSGGTVILVGQDGVQRPPIHFPRGGHLLAFLTCLENGLLPRGQLDPPLWSQRGKGKVFPKLRRRGHAHKTSSIVSTTEPAAIDSNPTEAAADQNGATSGETQTVEAADDDDDEDEANDYVFRLVSSSKPACISQEMLDPQWAESTSLWSPGGWSLGNGWPLSSSPSPTPPPAPPVSPRSPAPFKNALSAQPNRPSPLNSVSSTSSSSKGSLSAGDSVDGNATGCAKSPAVPVASIQVLCVTMKRQIISRAFYGWLAYCRHLRTVRTHLAGLVHHTIVPPEKTYLEGLTEQKWAELTSGVGVSDWDLVLRLVYFGGVEPKLRRDVWPYLLGHWKPTMGEEARKEVELEGRRSYETTMSEWLAVEAIVRQRDKEAMAANLAKLSSESTNGGDLPNAEEDEVHDHNLSNEVFEDNLSIGSSNVEIDGTDEEEEATNVKKSVSPDEGIPEDPLSVKTRSVGSSLSQNGVVVVTNTSQDSGNHSGEPVDEVDSAPHMRKGSNLAVDEIVGEVGGESKSPCISPASSQGGIYSTDLLDTFGLNLHRIDKDVQRCDRNYSYFLHPENLEKLRNVMCTYVWEHLDIGYMQGMCDLVAPLLVTLDEEALTYGCFCNLMERMGDNFPNGGAMDAHFANMRSLIQILDADVFELMHQNGDYTHFYFCYRWFLLDFKRELVYDDVFSVWETIWVAQHVASSHFVLFIALALVQYYRDIILDNNMDFTDIIKFFNEMAERHDAVAILKIARDLVLQLQTLIENK